ncbi:MAG: hypothetical protein LBO69_07570 [Ignavibacteria bacterium]|jgi:exonuclease VII large subunit|nr:hypothetical protein [Ignavibacteria bacterium]
MQEPSKEPITYPSLTFEKVWATLDRLSERSDKEARELREQTQRMSDQFRQELREMSAETDRQIREMSAETKARIKEVSDNLDKDAREFREKMDISNAKFDKMNEEFDKRTKQIREEIGGMGNNNGFMAEDLFFNTFKQKKEFAGYTFDTIEENTKKYVKNGGLREEYDIMMYNGDTVAIIETKHRAKVSALEQVLRKAENFRKIFQIYKDYRLILGLAAMSFDKDVVEKAQELGIGVVKFVGDTAEFHTENIKEY